MRSERVRSGQNNGWVLAYEYRARIERDAVPGELPQGQHHRLTTFVRGDQKPTEPCVIVGLDTGRLSASTVDERSSVTIPTQSHRSPTAARKAERQARSPSPSIAVIGWVQFGNRAPVSLRVRWENRRLHCGRCIRADELARAELDSAW